MKHEGKKMDKKANAIVLLLVAATLLAAIAIYTMTQFQRATIPSLSIEEAEAEVSLLLDDAIIKGLDDFLDYGYSYYSPDPGKMKGTPGWYCTDPLPPLADEVVSALEMHVMDHVSTAIGRFNAENPDVQVTEPTGIDVQRGATYDMMPEDSIRITLEDVKVSGTNEEGDTVEKTDDLVFERDYKVWNIYKKLHEWMADDLDDLTQRVYDLVEQGECKWRFCDCGTKALEDYISDADLVDRDDVIAEIEASKTALDNIMTGTGVTCELKIISENIDNVYEWENKPLSPLAAGGDPLTEQNPWRDQHAMCATDPWVGHCSLPEAEDPRPDDMSADPQRGPESMGVLYDPATSPEASRGRDAFYACPVETSVAAGITELDGRDRIYDPALDSVNTYYHDDDPAVPMQLISGPRIDLLGIHKTASVLFAIECESSDDSYMTPTGEKKLTARILNQVSWHKSCPKPYESTEDRAMCNTGECEIGGIAVKAGAEFFPIFGNPCTTDEDCEGGIIGVDCFFCGDDHDPETGQETGTKSCHVAADKIPVDDCHVCVDGDPAVPWAVAEPGSSYGCGNGGCSVCLPDGSCGHDPSYHDNEGIGCGNGCKICDANGQCVADPANTGPCGLCRACDGAGNCDQPYDDPTCGDTSNTCMTEIGCSGTTCQKDYAPAGTPCGTEPNPCGADYPKTCDGNGHCRYSGPRDNCCGSSVCTGSKECVNGRCVDPGTSVD